MFEQRLQLRSVCSGLLRASLAPLVALATTVAVSLLGIHGLHSGAIALQSALASASSTHELEAIAAKAQDVNGNLYPALTLRALQTDGSKSIDALVRQVQAQQRKDADLSLNVASTAIQAFVVVGAGSVLLAAGAAANMGWAAMRYYSLGKQNRTLKQLTKIDALTTLAKRRCFDETLLSDWGNCLSLQQPLTLIMLDIDHFKKFNDSQGHQAGDVCLRQVAAIIGLCTRTEADTVAPYGGEEFVIILPNTPLETGRSIAERVRLAVVARAIPHPAAGPPGAVTISLGLATMVPTPADSPSALIELADRGLYTAKRGGRNQVGEAAPAPVIAEVAGT